MDSVNKFKEIRFSNFLIAGLASVGATVVTNPIEVMYSHEISLKVKMNFKKYTSGYQN